jgi:hypothetical protein
MNRTLTRVVVALAAIMILLLGVVFVLVLQDTLSSNAESLPTLASTIAIQAEAEVKPTRTALPAPGIDVPPTFTPPPTSTPTITPEATSTPEPTNTPLPTNTLPPNTPTRTPVPILLPTNTPLPPTNTPPPTPVPVDTRGLVLTSFALQDRSIYSVGQPVWFGFSIANTSGGNVPFERLGVMPRKNGVDRVAWFQQSWGGNNDVIPPEGLSWEDHINLPEAGNYTLRLTICFDGKAACQSSSAVWVTLSQEIPVTIN